MVIQVRRGNTNSVVFEIFTSGSPSGTSPNYIFPDGWTGNVTAGFYATYDDLLRPPTPHLITVDVTVPSSSEIGSLATLQVDLNADDDSGGGVFRADVQVICGCVLTAEPSSGAVSGSSYTLRVTLIQDGCEEPLEDIMWSPEPDSGQGTTAAIYNDRQLSTNYSGTVSSSDADGCAASADFQFMIPIGGRDPSC